MQLNTASERYCPVRPTKCMAILGVLALACCVSLGGYPERAAKPSASARERERLVYPAARKSDQVDDYHGVKVADAYRWLEEPRSAETRAWVEAQVKLTTSYLE